MTTTAKSIMTLDRATPDEAKHNAEVMLDGAELGSVQKAVFIVNGQETESPCAAIPGSSTQAKTTVPNTAPTGSGQLYLKGTRDRRTNTVPFDVLPA